MIQERAKEYKRHSGSRRGQNEVVWNGYTAVPWHSSYEITNATTVTIPHLTSTVMTHFKWPTS